MLKALSAPNLRGLAEDWHKANDSGDVEETRVAAEAMACALIRLPADATWLYNDEDHFAILRHSSGVASRANCDDRAENHIAMAIALSDDWEPAYQSDEMREAAKSWIPEIFGDLFAYASSIGLDIYALISEGHTQALNHAG